MKKIKFSEWMTIIPTIFLVILISFLWVVTGFNKILFYALSIIILLAVYLLTYTLESQLFEYGESNIRNDDKELLTLEKDHSALWWAFITGGGIAFLLSGLPKIEENPIEAGIGLIFLILGNLLYTILYLPRYSLLIRKRKCKLELENPSS